MNVIYYADPTKVDQGGTGKRTIKSLIDAIGATKNATIVLAHNSNSTNTTYTIGTSTTISANINLKVEPGALISVSSGKTLTVNGPVDAGLYKIFTGSGTITGLKIAELAWFGFDASAVAATNDAAITKALTTSLYVRETRAGTYSTSSSITISTAYQTLYFGESVCISYSGTSAAILFSGVNYSKVAGLGRIICTSTSGSGILFAATATNDTMYNSVDMYWIQGAGRGATPDLVTGVGIEFDRINGTEAVYWNKVKINRMMDWNICVLFDAPNGTPADGANGNLVEGILCDNYWKAFKFRAVENTVIGCSGWGAGGVWPDYTYLYWFENSATYNEIIGGNGEPGGSLSMAYYLSSGCVLNTIEGNYSNFGSASVDLDTTKTNLILDGRVLSLPSGQVRFPATNVVSTDVNTFDDYDEGDWTAGMTCGTSGTITLKNTHKTGAYTKKGREVTVTGFFRVDSVSSPVGTLTLTGLPFTAINDTKYNAAVTIRADGLEATGTTAMQGWVIQNTKTIRIEHFAAGVAGAAAADIKADSDFIITATYFTAE